MSPEVAQLVAILDQAYNKTSWHGTNLRGSFPLKGSNWFRRPAGAAASIDTEWTTDLALLDDTHDALRAAVVRVSAADLSRTPPGKKVSNFALLSGVAAHDLYHAGQIQILKRLCPL